MGTPRAPAFSQSTSIRYSGTSSRPLGRTFGKTRVLGRHAEELVAGLHQLGMAQAAAVQQLEVESLGLCPVRTTAGGAKAKTMAFRILENAPMALPATAPTFRSGRSRRSQSFSLTKAIPCSAPGRRS